MEQTLKKRKKKKGRFKKKLDTIFGGV